MKSFYALMIALFISLCLQSFAYANDVVVIISRSLLPYEQAWEGFASTFSGDVQEKDMQGKAAEGQKMIQALSADSTSLIVTIGSEATMVAQKSQTTIPVIYTMVLEQPEIGDHIRSGVLMQVNLRKQLETLQQLFPDSQGTGVIYNLHYSGAVINQARKIVKDINMNLVPIAVESQADIPKALEKITQDKVGVLWSVVDPSVAKPESIQLSIKHSLKEKIPFIALSRYHVKAGALAALSVDYRDMGAQTAVMAKKVLAHQAVDTVQYPRKLILYVNADTKNKLGIKQIPSISGVQVIEE